MYTMVTEKVLVEERMVREKVVMKETYIKMANIEKAFQIISLRVVVKVKSEHQKRGSR